MSKLTVEVDRALAAGDKKVNGFKGAVRNLDTILVQGDEFKMPEDYTDKVYEQKLAGGTAQYIFVETTKGEVRKLYPSVFTKRRVVVDDNDVVTSEYISTNGTATDIFKGEGSIEKAMNALAGRTLIVSKVTPFRTTAFGRPGEVVNTSVYTIDVK